MQHTITTTIATTSTATITSIITITTTATSIITTSTTISTTSTIIILLLPLQLLKLLTTCTNASTTTTITTTTSPVSRNFSQGDSGISFFPDVRQYWELESFEDANRSRPSGWGIPGQGPESHLVLKFENEVGYLPLIHLCPE